MKRFSLTSPHAVALLLSLLLVTGCGGSSGKSLPAGARPVRLWHSMAGDLGKTMQVIVDKFNARHPMTPIVPVYQGGYDMLSQKIRTAVVAGQPPEMAQMYEAWTAFLNRDAGQEAVASLSPLLESPGFQKDDVFQVLRDDVTFDGHVLALPFNKSFPVMYYNKDLFAEAGLDPEKPPATWEEFTEYGRKLTKDTNGDGRIDQWGWSFVPDAWIYLCKVLQNGGEFLNESRTRARFDEQPAVDALQLFVDAIKGPNPYAYPSTEFEPQNEYVAGKVAMVISSSVSKSFMKPLIRFDMGLAPIPQGPKMAAIVSGTNVGIFRKAPEDLQKVAAEFLQFFTNTENTTYWSIKTNYIPVRHSATESQTWKEWVALDPTAGVAIKQMEYASFEPRFPEWVDCRKIINQAMSNAFQDRGNVAKHLATANTRINLTLARRMERNR